jgi:hypothetical protein
MSPGVPRRIPRIREPRVADGDAVWSDLELSEDPLGVARPLLVEADGLPEFALQSEMPEEDGGGGEVADVLPGDGEPAVDVNGRTQDRGTR